MNCSAISPRVAEELLADQGAPDHREVPVEYDHDVKHHRLKIAWLLGILGALSLALMLVGGCGSREGQASLRSLGPAAKGPGPADELGLVQERATQVAKREGIPCYKGVVRLGKVEGSVEFQARCKPVGSPERVGIVISRSALAGEEGLPIKAFQRYPTALEVTVGSRRGSCSRSRRDPPVSLICEVKAGHSVLIKGRIWVGQGNGCESSIKMTPVAPECQGNCPLEYVVVTLAQGPPRGC
jgi:hypothetical protein